MVLRRTKIKTPCERCSKKFLRVSKMNKICNACNIKALKNRVYKSKLKAKIKTK